MRVLIVFNHPYEGSFFSAILAFLTKGLETAWHDYDLIHLDRDEFDSIMRAKDLKVLGMACGDLDGATNLRNPQVQGCKARTLNAEHTVFILPIWWELMLAVTKRFIDKVIFPGIVYDYTPSGKA